MYTVLGQAIEVCLRCRDNRELLASPRPGLYLVREPVESGKSWWTDQWLPPDPAPAKPDVTPMIDEVRLARIKAGLRKGRAKWEFSYAFENMPIKETGRPYYPLMLLIVDTNSAGG